MKTISYTELRSDLKTNLDLACDNHETLIVHRSKGKSVVLMSLEDFNGYEETKYLLSTKANSDELTKNIDDVKAGKNIVKFDPTAH